MRRTFDSADYEHGCRCACCHDLFKDGDEMNDRTVDEWAGIPVSTPICRECAAASAPLADDHPCVTGHVTLRSDGLVV